MASSRKEIVGLSKADRILRALEQEIVSGNIATGERLPSENRLMQRFSVSRNTIRKGLYELESLGLITKRSGVGSFVTYDGSIQDDSVGWTRALALTGEDVDTRFLSIERSACSRTWRFVQELGNTTPEHPNDYLRIDRTRHLQTQDMGVSVERSRLPWRDEFQAILDDGLINNSLRHTLHELGITVFSGKEWAGMEPGLSQRDADLMHREAGMPMLRLRRATHDIHGNLIEYVESVLDPNHYSLYLSF